MLQTTKQRTRYKIDLPKDVVEVLRWHVDTQLPDIHRDSGAPFSVDFRRIQELGYHFTQIGLRRTFNDLARRAKVSDIVTRSVSGHATEEMQRHYSSVGSEEQVQGSGAGREPHDGASKTRE